MEQSSGPGKVPTNSALGKLPLSTPGKVPINAAPVKVPINTAPVKVPVAGSRGGAKVSTAGPGRISPKTSATSVTGPALKGISEFEL